MNVGWIGLGGIGSHMTGWALRAGHTVTAYARGQGQGAASAAGARLVKDYRAVAEASDVLAKIHEEIAETEAELADGAVPDRLEDEIGDVLFAVANLARKLDLDPEAALRRTNAKFENRFHFIEEELEKVGKSPSESSLDEMEILWQKAKTHERSGRS